MHEPATDAAKKPYQPPPKEVVETITKPFYWYFDPVFYGLEKVDKHQPRLYITNHTVYGITDGVLFTAELYLKKDIFLRSLVDKAHYKYPLWRDIIEYFGMVLGTRENCGILMQKKEHILVYPGGAREVCKKKHEKYLLTWKQRLGFARMAIQFGYDIQPVATLGGDDAYDIIFDSDDIMQSPIREFLLQTGIIGKVFRDRDHIPPIAKGLAFTPLPKPVRIYTMFGDPINTSRFKGKHDDEEALWQVRNETELAIYKMLLQLIEYRKKDRNISKWRRLLTHL